MTAGAIAIDVLLALCVVLCCAASLGLVQARGAIAKLHYTAILASVALPAAVIAICIQEGAKNSTVKAILILVLSTLTNAVLTHATARAVRVHEVGTWRAVSEDIKRLEAE